MISVVDGFEAMVSDRAYHRARSMDEALAVLDAGAGAHWDADIVRVWTQLVREQAQSGFQSGLAPR